MREYQTQYICERCNQPYQITRNTPTNNKYCWPCRKLIKRQAKNEADRIRIARQRAEKRAQAEDTIPAGEYQVIADPCNGWTPRTILPRDAIEMLLNTHWTDKDDITHCYLEDGLKLRDVSTQKEYTVQDGRMMEI